MGLSVSEQLVGSIGEIVDGCRQLVAQAWLATGALELSER